MLNFLLCLAKALHCFINFDAFLTLFSGKRCYKVVFIIESKILQSHMSY